MYISNWFVAESRRLSNTKKPNTDRLWFCVQIVKTKCLFLSICFRGSRLEVERHGGLDYFCADCRYSQGCQTGVFAVAGHVTHLLVTGLVSRSEDLLHFCLRRLLDCPYRTVVCTHDSKVLAPSEYWTILWLLGTGLPWKYSPSSTVPPPSSVVMLGER